MTQRTTRWFGQAAALALGGVALVAVPACLESPLGSNAYFQAVATNNKIYDGTGPKNSDFSDAVQASGAHDIPCPITQVTAHWVKEHQWTAEGCGERIDYVAKQKFAVPWKISLESRAKMPPGAARLAPPPSAAVTPAATCVDPPPKPAAH